MFQQDWEGLGDVTDLDLEKLAIVFFGAKTLFYQYYTGHFVLNVATVRLVLQSRTVKVRLFLRRNIWMATTIQKCI